MGAGASALTRKSPARQSPMRGKKTINQKALSVLESRECTGEVADILSQLQINSPADIARMKEKHKALRNNKAGGLSLLRALHDELTEIENEKKEGRDFLALVSGARMRVTILLKEQATCKQTSTVTNFMVAVDGSSLSNVAYEVVIKELMSPDKDGLIALHVYDSQKVDKGLDPKLKPEALKERFEVDLMTRVRKNRLLWKNKCNGSTCKILVKTVRACIRFSIISTDFLHSDVGLSLDNRSMN